MIADWDTDALQGHKKEIGTQGVKELILTLERLKMPLSLPEQLNRSLGFANVRRLLPVMSLSGFDFVSVFI